MEFRERLKNLRKENNLTQSALGGMLNYGYTAISNYESGRNEPSIKDLKKIAKYFGVSMDYLLCVNDTRDPYVERDYPEKFNEIKNAYSILEKDNRESLSSFLEWLLDRQIKDQVSTKRRLKVAQGVPTYKTKDTEKE